jgi:hypothetical protein
VVRELSLLSGVAALALVVSACGGGGSAGPTPLPTQTAPPPLVYTYVTSIQGSQTPVGGFGATGMSGNFVSIKVPALIEAEIDWTPTDAIVDLYITTSIRSSFPLVGCTLTGPCQSGFLAADVDPTKRPKKVTSSRLEPGEYTVLLYNRSGKIIEVTGKIGYYAVN